MKSPDTEYETLALDEATPGVVMVTLNRPDRYNAMTNVTVSYTHLTLPTKA